MNVCMYINKFIHTYLRNYLHVTRKRPMGWTLMLDTIWRCDFSVAKVAPESEFTMRTVMWMYAYVLYQMLDSAWQCYSSVVRMWTSHAIHIIEPICTYHMSSDVIVVWHACECAWVTPAYESVVPHVAALNDIKGVWYFCVRVRIHTDVFACTRLLKNAHLEVDTHQHTWVVFEAQDDVILATWTKGYGSHLLPSFVRKRKTVRSEVEYIYGASCIHCRESASTLLLVTPDKQCSPWARHRGQSNGNRHVVISTRMRVQRLSTMLP